MESVGPRIRSLPNPHPARAPVGLVLGPMIGPRRRPDKRGEPVILGGSERASFNTKNERASLADVCRWVRGREGRPDVSSPSSRV
ncbi:hypothetical protein NL676_033742 [Syzygium grande]|nr:hypothetical protein NL676_033742 [Syzygium grande]